MNGFIRLTAVAGCVLPTAAPLGVGAAEDPVHCLHTALVAHGLLAAFTKRDAFVTDLFVAAETLFGFSGAFAVAFAFVVCHTRGLTLGGHGSLLHAELCF